MQFALSARSIFRELSANDETFRLFCSVAAKGENQGGWENDRIAAKTLDAELSAKIARHGADEHKHGRLFAGLLRRRGLEPIEVPAAADYCMRLERAGIGLSHERLLEDRPLSDAEILKYLIHSRVTEQRAFEEITQQKRVFRGHPELEKPIAAIAADEVDHLAYCHEELLRFEGNGYGALIHQLLREYALVEIRTYRDVSVAVMTRMGDILGWSKLKKAVLTFGIHAIYWIERAGTWRRMTTLRAPERANPLGAPDVTERGSGIGKLESPRPDRRSLRRRVFGGTLPS